jgi:Putative transposase
LSCMFRGLFLRYLDKAFAGGELNFFSAHRHLREPAAFQRYLAPVHTTKWVVFAKRPFAGPAQVLDYVGRYTHRVAISNNRLVSMDDGKVRFRWKDYRDDNRQKTMALPADEFIRRLVCALLTCSAPGN